VQLGKEEENIFDGEDEKAWKGNPSLRLEPSLSRR